MEWSEIESWAKDKGYKVFREKSTDLEQNYKYYWTKDSDVSVTGISADMDYIMIDIYRDMTSHLHLGGNNSKLKNMNINYGNSNTKSF